MGIWQWVFQRRTATVAEVAERAAALVVESIRPQVEKRVARMGIHEARGYVRARAGFLVKEAIAMVTAHDPPSRRHATAVVYPAALEATLRLLYRRPGALAPVRRVA